MLRHPLIIFGPSIIPAILFFSSPSFSNITYEINGSPYAVEGAPLVAHIPTAGEKLIYVSPQLHVWGAYNKKGKLVRWGIATAGKDWCRDTSQVCKTHAGYHRVYSFGDEGCSSKKFPLPDGGAPMPYCMYFNGGQALHGSSEVVFNNVSHGCIRMHVDDAKWLRYHFVEAPKALNHFHGTQVYIEPY